ncbi:MAG: crossover junction endodeoxyribonuclease RuvC [Verrucomicrobiota bacterium]
MQILGIDPSVRSTGYGIIELQTATKIKVVTYGTIRNPENLSQSACYLNITETLRDLIRNFSPTEAALENIIYVQNTRTAIAMGGARGAALVACAESGLNISEYPAKVIKKSATGLGSAAKQQVGFMMRATLGLKENPSSDEADALAIALTHSRHTT